MPVTPQRHAIYRIIMPVEELFVHLPDLIDGEVGAEVRGVYKWATGRETRVESDLLLIYRAIMT